MIAKKTEKEKAVHLRKQGLSYSEILNHVSVTKSTLSLWLRSVNLSKRQKRRLSEKMAVSALKGAKARRDKRIAITKQIQNEAKNEINRISDRELWLIGSALYWAEGSKQKEYYTGQGVVFNNSDPGMIKVFLRWLNDIIKINKKDICFEVYLHENHKNNVKKFLKYWARVAEVDIEKMRFYFKKNKIKTNRRNKEGEYRGLLRVKVRRSSMMNRKISGWVKGIIDNIAG